MTPRKGIYIGPAHGLALVCYRGHMVKRRQASQSDIAVRLGLPYRPLPLMLSNTLMPMRASRALKDFR